MEIVDEEPEEEEDAETQRQRLQELPIKLAIVGKLNVGKSTLTNRIFR